MDGFISALTGTNGITGATFWGSMTSLVPYLVIIIPVALGFYLARRALKGAGKAKIRV